MKWQILAVLFPCTQDVLPKAMEVYTKEADRKCSVIVDREEFLLPDRYVITM